MNPLHEPVAVHASETTSVNGHDRPRNSKNSDSGHLHHLTHEVGTLTSGNDGSSTFTGSSSGIYFFKKISQVVASAAAERPVEIGFIPVEEDHISSQGPAQVQQLILDKDTLPPRPEAYELVQTYFRIWHPLLPFLQGDIILADLDSAYRGEPLGVGQSVILRAVLSVVAFHRADQHSLSESDEQMSSRLASAIFSSPGHALSFQQYLLCNNSLRSLQALLAIQFYLVFTMNQRAAVRLGGSIIRMAQDMGLHRCPYKYPRLSLHEVDIRKRVFWSIYILDRHTSQGLGLPLGIRDDDIDVCLPGLSAEAHTRDEGFYSDVDADDSRLARFITITEHSRLTGRILELFNKAVVSRTVESDRIMRLNAELGEWWNAASDYASSEELERVPQVETTSQSFHRVLLFILYHQSIILINRPALSLEPDRPEHSAALQTCIGSAKATLAKLNRYLHSSSASGDVWKTHELPLIMWPGFVSATWTAGMTLLYASWCDNYSIDQGIRDLEICIRVLGILSRSWRSAKACSLAISSLKEILNSRMSRMSRKRKAPSALLSGREGPIFRNHDQNLSTSPSVNGMSTGHTDTESIPSPGTKTSNNVNLLRQEISTIPPNQGAFHSTYSSSPFPGRVNERPPEQSPKEVHNIPISSPVNHNEAFNGFKYGNSDTPSVSTSGRATEEDSPLLDSVLVFGQEGLGFLYDMGGMLWQDDFGDSGMLVVRDE